MDNKKILDGISNFNRERIEEWKKLTTLMHDADDNTKCPICKEQMIGCSCVKEMAQDILESLFYRKIIMKGGNICELCGKEIPMTVIFNTNALTIAEYFTDLEYRKDMGKEGKWCFDCTHKEREKK